MSNELTTIRENLVNYLKVVGGEAYDKLDKLQISSFIQVAQAYQLNPFKKEIYAIPFKKSDNTYQLTVVVGYEAYIKKAERSGLLSGWKLTRKGEGEQLEIIVTIKRKGWEESFEYSLRLCDVPPNIRNKPGSQWTYQALFMLEKMTISRAFRLAFSEENGGLQEFVEEEKTVDIQDGKGNSINPVANSAAESRLD